MPTKAFATTLAALCLLISGCASTGKPSVVVKTERVKERIPAALLRPCPPKQRTPLVITGDIVNRVIYTEGALDTCDAQVTAIRNWDKS